MERNREVRGGKKGKETDEEGKGERRSRGEGREGREKDKGEEEGGEGGPSAAAGMMSTSLSLMAVCLSKSVLPGN